MTPFEYEFAQYGDQDGSLEEWPDEVELSEVLRGALDDAYSDAAPIDLEEALQSVLDGMSPAESFNFTKALKQIETGAQRALSDPTVGQVLRTALPIAGGAAGTVIGGPVGTALGSSLGNAVAGALPGAAPTRSAPPAQTPPIAGGSAAAAQGLVLSQQPDVLKGLLALALGQHGQQSVNGVPVARIMGMLSSVFGQAAADADELMYLDRGGAGEEGEALDAEEPVGRSLYTTLLDAENYELAEEIGR